MSDTNTTPAPEVPVEWQDLGAPPPVEEVVDVEVSALEVPWATREDVLDLVASSDAAVAGGLVAAGVMWWLFAGRGWRVLASLNLAALGAWGGWMVAEMLGHSGWSGLTLGALVAGIAAWPASKSAITLSGGIVGFVLGCVAWRLVGLDETYLVAGALLGAVVMLMLPLATHRLGATVVLAAQGTVMFGLGLLGFVMAYEPIATFVADGIKMYPVALPSTLLASTFAALFAHHAWEQQIAAKK
jgi:hypothetical protein